jgi:hypothetical protein
MFMQHRGERRGIGGIFFDDMNDRDPEEILKFSTGELKDCHQIMLLLLSFSSLVLLCYEYCSHFHNLQGGCDLVGCSMTGGTVGYSKQQCPLSKDSIGSCYICEPPALMTLVEQVMMRSLDMVLLGANSLTMCCLPEHCRGCSSCSRAALCQSLFPD